LILLVVVNFTTLLLIEFGIVNGVLNFFGLYALLYGFLFSKYSSEISKNHRRNIQASNYFILLLVLVFIYVILQFLKGDKIQFLNYDLAKMSEEINIPSRHI
jgi:uncharacterized membrane protein